MAIDIGDLELAARRRLETRRNIRYSLIVEVQTGYCVARARRAWFLLKRQHPALGVDLRNAVTLRIGDRISKYRRAPRLFARTTELRLQIVPVENVVAENQCRMVAA